MNRTARVFLLGLALGVSGCSLNTPTPPRSTFLPRPALERASAQAVPLPGLLLVNVFSVAEAFAGKPMVYRFDEHRYETDFYNQFLVAPRDLVTQGALEWLQRASLFESVAPAAGARAPHALLLQGTVNELYADVRDPHRPAAVLAIRFHVVDEIQPVRPLRMTAEVRRSVPMADASAGAFADGVSRAMTEVFEELEQRLRDAAANLPG